MSVDAIGLAKDFSIFDPSVLSEEDRANNRRFPTPKEFVDSASAGGGDISLDELGKAYARHYKDYATKSVGMSPALADAKALAVQNMFFNGKDANQFNDAWSGVLNPQQAQAKAQEQAKVAQGDAGHLDNIQRGYYQQSAADYLSSAMDDMAQAEAATRVRAGQDWLSNRAATNNKAMVIGGGGQPTDITNQISSPLPPDPYGVVAQTNEQSAITNVQQAQTQLDKANALPTSKGIEEFSKTQGFFDAAGNLISNPFDTAIPLIEQSLAPMASQLGAAAGGALVAGIPGAMVAGGAASYDVNRASKILEESQKTGKPLIDIVRDMQLRGEIQGEASRYASVVGLADAASMGLAGVTMPARTILGRAAQQTGLQMALGAGGEAGGQLAQSGEITSGQEIAAEGVLEGFFGVGEAGIARLTQGNKAQPATNRDTPLNTTTITPEPLQAGVNPLSQFAQKTTVPDQASSNEQLLLPAKPQPHPDDVYYVDQAGRAQYANPTIPRSFGGQGVTGQAIRGKSIGDLIASGEGDYQSFNRGVAGDSVGEKIDFSQMTVAEVMQRQSLPQGNPNRIFTVGKYQAIPETFAEAVQKLGIPADTKVTPALQEYIFSEYLLKDKRPDIRDYITGKTDNLKAAQKAGALEWASVADPDTGLSAYGNVGNNKASIAADTFGRSLESVRKAYADAIAQGASPDEAWSLSVSTQSSLSQPITRTSQGFQRTAPEQTGNDGLSTGIPEANTPDEIVDNPVQNQVDNNQDSTLVDDPANDIETVMFDSTQTSLLDDWRKKRKLDDLVNQEVDYNGITGFLAKRGDAFVVIGQSGDVPIGSGLSGRTANDLGVTPLSASELNIPERSVVTTDFGNNKISVYGKNFQYVSANSDKDGITNSVNLIDEAGNNRVIRNKEIVNLIEAEKIAHELEQNYADSAEAIQAIRNRTQAIKADTRTSARSNAPITAGINTTQPEQSRGRSETTQPQLTAPLAANTPTANQSPSGLATIDVGKRGTIYDADNNEHEVSYQIVDAYDLSAAKDKAFNQNRNRARNEAQRQVDNITKNPTYGRLNMMHSTFTDGAPVLLPDNSIIAGNGRVLGLQGAYSKGNANNYKVSLINDLRSQGINTSAVENMRAPILVRRLADSNVELGRLAVLSNKPTALDLSPSEQAVIDAGYIKTLSDFNPDSSGDINFKSASSLFKRLRAAAPENERNSIMTDDGQVGAEGIRRVKNALLYMAYGDSPVLQRLTESGDAQKANITKALVNAAPVMAELRDSINQGIIFDADITPYLIDAFAIFTQIKATKGTTVDSWLSQLDAFNEIAPETKVLLKRLDETTNSPNKLTQFLANYAEKLKAYGPPAQAGLFGNTLPPTQAEVISRAEQDASNQSGYESARARSAGANNTVSEQTAGQSRVKETDRRGSTGSWVVEGDKQKNPLYNISPRPLNLTGNDTPLTTAWKLIAAQDDAFQLPISSKKTLADIATDYDPDIKVKLGTENKTQRQWVIRFPNGKSFQEATVTEGKGRDKTIYLDISTFKTGSGGRTVYQMVGDYAHNTGKVFIGDPNGLSAIAQIRRTENMLSSALRWGTTDHLQPHELQLKPDSPNATPFQWKVGNTEFNIDQMLRASMSNLLNQIPELGQIRYNFESQQFEKVAPNGTVRPFGETAFESIANQSRGARAAQAGRTTLKRAVVSASVLSGQGQAAWNAILGNLVRQPNQQLGPLSGILYGLNPSFDQTIHQIATDKQLSTLAEDALLSVFGGSPKNQTIATRLLRQFFFDNFVPSDTYPDSRSFVTAQMDELRSSGTLQAINEAYFNGTQTFKLKDDANRKPISADKAEAAIRRILGDIPFETNIPNDIRAGAGEAAERVKGAFANGKIYIDTRNIGSIAEAEALAVEELTHRGVANLFGDEYDSRLDALYEAIGGEAGIRRFTEQHKIEMAEDYFKQSPTAQMDELLAHIEANQNTLTVRVKLAFQRILAHLRNAIRALNTRVLHNVSDSDIVLLARNARNAAKNAVNNPVANPRFGIRPEQESAAINEQQRIRDEFNARPKLNSSARVRQFIYSGRQSLLDKKATVQSNLFKKDSDWLNAVNDWKKRYFYSDSTLGRDVADARRGIDWSRAASHDAVISDAVLLEAMTQNIYGKPRSELTPAEQEQFHRVLTGQETFANANYQADVQYFRSRIDEASQELITEKHREMQMRISELNDEGKSLLYGIADELLAGSQEVAVPPALANIAKLQNQINTIESNKGTYLHRSYQAFTDPRWAKKVRKQPVFNDAVEFVIQQRAQQIKEDADAQVLKIKDSIERIQSRASKLSSLQDELAGINKKINFRVNKLQQLSQVNTKQLTTNELAAHQRRVAIANKELTDFNEEASRLAQRIGNITSRNFKLDKSERDQIERHKLTIQQVQAEKLAVDKGTHPNLLNKEQATGILNQWLESANNSGSMLEFSSGQGTNEGILKQRKDIPPVLRQLLGEFKDPVYNYANTITQVSDYVAKQRYQMKLRQLLLSMPNIAFIGKEPEGMKVATFPKSAAYSALNDLYVDADFMRDLKEFGVLEDIQNPFINGLVQLSSAVKLGKTVLSPTTAMRNFWSGFMLLAAAGHSPFGGMADAYHVISNAKNRMGLLSGNLILNEKEAAELNKKYIRLGVRRDGASSGELAGIFRDFHQADEAVKEQGLARKSFNAALAFYQFGDDFFKIIHFEKGYADLIEAGLSPAEAEQEAARRTRDTMPTYSMVPKALQQLRRFPLIGTFVSFPWEVMRTLKNSLDLIRHDYRMAKQTGNSKWASMANKRVIGLTVAYAVPILAVMLSRSLAGIDDDDNEALDHFSSDWRKGQLRLFLGGDAKNPTYLDMTPLIPSEYIMKSLRIGVQKGSDEGIWSGLFNTSAELGKPFYSFDIAAKGIFNLFTNRDDNGRVIYGEGKSITDLLANPVDNSQHMGEALGYLSRQFGPGIIQNINDFNRALSGSVADAESAGFFGSLVNERAAAIGGKVSRSGKEFNLGDAVAALVGFRMTNQNMTVLGQQAARQTRDKIASYSAEFKRAVDVTTPLSNEFLDSRLQQVRADRERAFSKMIDLTRYYRKKLIPDAEIVDILYDTESANHPFSKETVAKLIKGEVPKFTVSKEIMSSSLRAAEKIEDPRSRLQAKRSLAERYRYLNQRAAEMQQTQLVVP